MKSKKCPRNNERGLLVVMLLAIDNVASIQHLTTHPPPPIGWMLRRFRCVQNFLKQLLSLHVLMIMLFLLLLELIFL